MENMENDGIVDRPRGVRSDHIHAEVLAAT